MPLDRIARERAVTALRDVLAHEPDVAVASIPIDDARWNRFFGRLQGDVATFLDARLQVGAEAVDDDFVTLRSAAQTVASALVRLERRIQAATAFIHPRRAALLDLRAAARALTTLWQARLTTGEGQSTFSDTAVAEVRTTLTRVRTDAEQPAIDPWQISFGIDRNHVLDDTGRFSPALLLAAFHNRYDELTVRLNTLLAGLAPAGLDPAKGLGYVPALIDSADPIETVDIAFRTRDLIGTAAKADPAQVRRVLGRLHEDVERSYANSVMITDTRLRIADERRPDLAAMLRLELYRRVSEGQVRPWGWAMVCLFTGIDGELPMLSELHDRLRAIPHDLTEAFAECVEIGARNAAAHEDYRWEPKRGQLIVKGGTFRPDELTALSDRGLGLMTGAELGWALASAADPRLLSGGSSNATPSVLQILPALNRFGANRLRPLGWHLDGDGLVVDLAELKRADFCPCAQALIEVGAVVEVDQIVVRLKHADDSVMVATRQVLDACLQLWFMTHQRRPKMPPAVFLPIFFQSRLLVETAEEAVSAVIWLALNEGVHFVDDYIARRASRLPLQASIATLADDLWLASEALAICAAAAPGQLELLGRAFRLLRGASIHARALADHSAASTRVDRQRLDAMTHKIRSMCHALPPCAALPTVDLAPLDKPR